MEDRKRDCQNVWEKEIMDNKDHTNKIKKIRLNNFIIFMLFSLLIGMTLFTIFSFEYTKKILTESSFLVLKGISIYGNNNVKSTDIFESIGLSVGADQLYSFMSHIVEKQIKSKSPYVKDVKVKRDLLKGYLVVNVEERNPSAIVAKSLDSDIFMVVDVDGFILEKIKDKRIYLSSYGNMPFIFDGNTKPNAHKLSETESYVASESANLGLKVLSEAKSEIPELISTLFDIDARNPDDIILHLRGGLNIKLASDRIKEGLSSTRNLILSSKLRYFDNSINYIDARFPGAIYCG